MHFATKGGRGSRSFRRGLRFIRVRPIRTYITPFFRLQSFHLGGGNRDKRVITSETKFVAHKAANDGVKFSHSFAWLIFALLRLVSRYRQVKVVVNSVDTIKIKRAN